MKCVILLALVTIKVFEQSWITVGQIFEPPSDLARLCPLSTFCNKTGEPAIQRLGYEACCQSCGCDAECGRRRDCCTYEMDTWRLVEQNMSTCVSPLCNAGPLQEALTFRYHMVDRCTDKTHKCTSDGLYPWGSMFPHSSISDGFVYYNKFCALCNDISDVVPWKLAVACPNDALTGGESISYTHTVELFLNGKSNEIESCFFYFSPRPEPDVRHERCFQNEKVMRHCMNDSEYSNEIKEDLQQKCFSFNATYTTPSLFRNTAYANVYCYLCGGMANELHTECRSHDGVDKLMNDQSFVTILDSILVQPKISSMTWEHCYQNICRPVLCPEGQIHMAGSCNAVYSFVETLCTIYVELRFMEPNDKIKIDVLEHFISNDLNMHNLNGWTVTLFFVTNRTSSVPNYLVVRVFKYMGKGNIGQIVSMVERSVKKPWILTLQGLSWSFSASFYKCTSLSDTNYMSNNYTVTLIPAWWRWSKNVWQSSPERIAMLYHHWTQMGDCNFRMILASMLTLTKLFFCYQVELLETEFMDLEYEIVLVRYNRTLQEGEFTRVRELNGALKIRVCLEAITDLQSQNKAVELHSSMMNAIFVIVVRMLGAFTQYLYL